MMEIFVILEQSFFYFVLFHVFLDYVYLFMF